jgi:hypothetical protein
VRTTKAVFACKVPPRLIATLTKPEHAVVALVMERQLMEAQLPLVASLYRPADAQKGLK